MTADRRPPTAERRLPTADRGAPTADRCRPQSPVPSPESRGPSPESRVPAVSLQLTLPGVGGIVRLRSGVGRISRHGRDSGLGRGTPVIERIPSGEEETHAAVTGGGSGRPGSDAGGGTGVGTIRDGGGRRHGA